MAPVAHGVERLLDRMVSFSSQGLQKVDIQEHFLIVKELGKGSFGKIFSAHNRNTGN